MRIYAYLVPVFISNVAFVVRLFMRIKAYVYSFERTHKADTNHWGASESGTKQIFPSSSLYILSGSSWQLLDNGKLIELILIIHDDLNVKNLYKIFCQTLKSVSIITFIHFWTVAVGTAIVRKIIEPHLIVKTQAKSLSFFFSLNFMAMSAELWGPTNL